MIKYYSVLVIFFSFIFLTGSVSAWGPATHLNETLTALQLTNDTLIAHIIQDNFDACMVGLSYADVGIFEYYTNFKEYKALHNYNVVSEMLRLAKTDRDRAFIYCFKIHLAEDGVSHNLYVPSAIKKTKLPDYILHPIVELKIEGRYPDPRANRLMEKHAEFDWLVTQASGRDWTPEADKLNIILGGGTFYSKAYNPESSTTFGKVQRGFFWLVEKMVSPETGVDYYKLSISEAQGVLRGETSDLDPSGEAALRASDQGTQLWLYAGTFVIVLTVFIVSFKKHWIGFRRG